MEIQLKEYDFQSNKLERKGEVGLKCFPLTPSGAGLLPSKSDLELPSVNIP
jgi:hypothetical protein